MGELHRFDLQPFVEKFNLKTYFETGTGKAVSLRHALRFSFDDYFSVDIDSELIEEASYLKKECVNLTLIEGFSKDAIRDIVPVLDNQKAVLFFLDAHFPGADFHKISYENSIRKYKKDAFPLLGEIQLIKSLRDTSKDMFIIDDLMLYEMGDYGCFQEGVFWKYEWLQKELGLETSSEPIYEAFENTHSFKKDLRDQGYLLITPQPANIVKTGEQI